MSGGIEGVMDSVVVLLFTYITVMFSDISMVMYFHNKYGYIHYFKNSLYRQLMYMALFSSFLYVALPNTYMEKYSSVTLVLAIIQFLLYFQIVFEGIHNPKVQILSTSAAILFIVLANFTGSNIIVRIAFILISIAAIVYYLRHYEMLGIESLSMFIMVWIAFGFNEYIYLNLKDYFFIYWLIIFICLWLTESFLSSLYSRSSSNFVDYSTRNIKVNTSELKDKILEFAPVSLILTDHTSKIIYVNKSVERMTGYPTVELIGAKTRIFQSGETPITTYQDMWQTIKRGKQWQGTLKNKRKDGTNYWEDVTIIPIVNTNNIITNYLGVKFDSSKAMVERSILENNAHYDDLTGTLRRRRFNELMNETLQSKRNGPFYVVMIDVDKFKSINDSYGHATGDRVLTKISQRISEVYSSKNSFLSRIGGDEFVIFTYGLKKNEVYHGAKLIRETVSEINQMEEFKNIEVSVSIGISKVTRGLELALKKADTMMYSNKAKSNSLRNETHR